MTDRDITGDAVKTGSAYRRAQAIAKERGLLDADLRTIADGVREFDAQRSLEARTLGALEALAKNTSPDRDRDAAWAFEERRHRRREVLAQELAAVALLADEEEVDKIKAGVAYQRLFERLTVAYVPGEVPSGGTPS